MGNNTSQYSCCHIGFSKSSKTAKLLDVAGNVREVKVPVKSAEIMIEEPGHVITPVDELRRTRRISALPADEELLDGKVYLLVPVTRLHSKASEFDIAITEQCDIEKKKNKSCQRKKPIGNLTKVSPILMVREEENDLNMFSGKGTGMPCRGLGKQGRWNPVLEPIFESSRDFGN